MSNLCLTPWDVVTGGWPWHGLVRNGRLYLPEGASPTHVGGVYTLPCGRRCYLDSGTGTFYIPYPQPTGGDTFLLRNPFRLDADPARTVSDVRNGFVRTFSDVLSGSRLQRRARDKHAWPYYNPLDHRAWWVSVTEVKTHHPVPGDASLSYEIRDAAGRLRRTGSLEFPGIVPVDAAVDFLMVPDIHPYLPGLPYGTVTEGVLCDALPDGSKAIVCIPMWVYHPMYLNASDGGPSYRYISETGGLARDPAAGWVPGAFVELSVSPGGTGLTSTVLKTLGEVAGSCVGDAYGTVSPDGHVYEGDVTVHEEASDVTSSPQILHMYYKGDGTVASVTWAVEYRLLYDRTYTLWQDPAALALFSRDTVLSQIVYDRYNSVVTLSGTLTVGDASETHTMTYRLTGVQDGLASPVDSHRTFERTYPWDLVHREEGGDVWGWGFDPSDNVTAVPVAAGGVYGPPAHREYNRNLVTPLSVWVRRNRTQLVAIPTDYTAYTLRPARLGNRLWGIVADEANGPVLIPDPLSTAPALDTMGEVRVDGSYRVGIVCAFDTKTGARAALDSSMNDSPSVGGAPFQLFAAQGTVNPLTDEALTGVGPPGTLGCYV